jgi:hypothetical protein
MTANAALSVSLLRAIPNPDPLAGAPLSGDSTFTAMSKWCADCHYNRGINGQTTGSVTGFSQYYNTAFNGRSHIMTAAANMVSYGNAAATTPTAQVAWSGSAQCMECHAAGTPVVEGFTNIAQSATNNFPHYTQSAVYFLEASEASGAVRSGASTNDADGVCLTCHRRVSGGTTVGIGLTY